MKIISNDKYIDRNKKLSKITMIASLVFLGFSFIAMLNGDPNSFLFFPSLIAGAIGIILATINIPLTSRFGGSPRPDELITRSLKGLGDEFSLFHFIADVPHLLAGPNGLWAIIPYQVKGKVIYDKSRNKWKLKKKGNYLVNLFGSEGLGNPGNEARVLIKDHQQQMKGNKEFTDLPDLTPLALFLSDSIELEAGDSPFPALQMEKIKNFIRKYPNLPKDKQVSINKYKSFLLLQ